MMEDMEKLYVYVDESGQDTEGVYFVAVAVVLLEGSVSVSRTKTSLEFQKRYNGKELDDESYAEGKSKTVRCCD